MNLRLFVFCGGGVVALLAEVFPNPRGIIRVRTMVFGTVEFFTDGQGP